MGQITRHLLWIPSFGKWRNEWMIISFGGFSIVQKVHGTNWISIISKDLSMDWETLHTLHAVVKVLAVSFQITPWRSLNFSPEFFSVASMVYLASCKLSKKKSKVFFVFFLHVLCPLWYIFYKTIGAYLLCILRPCDSWKRPPSHFHIQEDFPPGINIVPEH